MRSCCPLCCPNGEAACERAVWRFPVRASRCNSLLLDWRCLRTAVGGGESQAGQASMHLEAQSTVAKNASHSPAMLRLGSECRLAMPIGGSIVRSVENPFAASLVNRCVQNSCSASSRLTVAANVCSKSSRSKNRSKRYRRRYFNR